MANHLNRYFVSLSAPLCSVPDEPVEPPINATDRFTIPIMNQKFIFDQISSMPMHKAVGTDNIGAKIIKLSCPHIIPPLTHIFNLSIGTNKFPDRWKDGKVLPLFKGGASTDPGNYRPISVLPILSKILERHIANHLKNFLERNHLLHRTQSGFRSKHSCMTALTTLFNKWFKILDKSKSIGVYAIQKPSIK